MKTDLDIIAEQCAEIDHRNEAVVHTWIGLRIDELKEQIKLCYEVNGERCDPSGVCPNKAVCDAIWLVVLNHEVNGGEA